MRRFLVNVVIAAAVIVAWFHWRPRLPGPARATAGVASIRSLPSIPLSGPAAFIARANPNPPAGDAIEDEPSELAIGLNSPTSDIHADLRQVDAIFAAYRSATHGDNPVGDNADITAVLIGRNKLGFAFIPADCPAINSQGELCDRWGTPYFFHQLSGEEMEIRSAGPDRKMWTADDEVLTP
jgi:hypothetical protein